MDAKHDIKPSSELDTKLAEETRETIKASLKLLRAALPDTFLGRATGEPFPKQKTD
jgi:hypothetical protein